MSEIYLIRHAQASFGSDNYDRLSPLGVRQADLLARFLSRHGVRFDAVYSGPMQRQRDTAEPVCRLQGTTLQVVPALSEYDHMALIRARIQREKMRGHPVKLLGEDLRRDPKAFQAYFSKTVDRWMAGDYDDDAGVETWPDLRRRVNDGVEEIMAAQGRGKRLAVVTSGGPISVMLSTALGLSDRQTAVISWEILNASITCFKYSAERLSLTVFNNTTHFLIDGDASLFTHR